MDMSHARRELPREIAATEMDIEQRRLDAAMAGEGGDLMDVPTGARKINQTEMSQCVGLKPSNASPA